jgi:hypothetical protein
MPSGCSFWRLAEEGRTFYTVPSDHYNCALGSHTHNIPLPQERARELDQTLSFMTGIGYIRMEEIPHIPRLPQTPRVVIYAPLGDTGRPGRGALRGSTWASDASARGCAARGRGVAGSLFRAPDLYGAPAALAQGAVASTGCIGNRVYTDLGEDELYLAIPGKDLAGIADEVETIAAVNAKLSEFHRGRRQALATE